MSERHDEALCSRCGRPVDVADPEAELPPWSDEPVCGECVRERDDDDARNFYVLDIADGELDGWIG